MWIIAPLVCGLIFGAGLLISGMVQPTKVLGFLDIFGAWDPSLAVVMAAALAVSVPGFRLADRGAQPWFAGQYFRPGKSGIDLPLVAGAALFGIGWGLVGLCPGPALESLATLSPGSSSLSPRWPPAWWRTTPGNSRGGRRNASACWRAQRTAEVAARRRAATAMTPSG